MSIIKPYLVQTNSKSNKEYIKIKTKGIRHHSVSLEPYTNRQDQRQTITFRIQTISSQFEKGSQLLSGANNPSPFHFRSRNRY